MKSKNPIVVIGGGHNGLTAAALLAQAGRSVVLCEARSKVGGIAAAEEFHPGFFTTGLWHESARVRSAVVRDLSLEGHGFSLEKQDAPVYIPQADGPGLVLHRDAQKAFGEINVHSASDAKSYGDWRAELEQFREPLQRILGSPPSDPNSTSASGFLDLLKSGLSLRLLGSRQLVELTRIVPMCLADWMNERFQTELLKAALAAPPLMGNWCGPWSPGTAALSLIAECSSQREVRGGPAALVGCLERAATHHGVQLRLDSRVTRIELERGRVSAVVLEGGETIPASAVLSACDPKHTLLELLEPRALSTDVTQRIESFRTRGTTAKVHLALDALPRFLGRPDSTFEKARTGESLDAIERTFDAAKYGTLPLPPQLDIRFPSITDPELAPPGKHVASILVHSVPHELKAGWDATQRAALEASVLAQLRKSLPDLDRVLIASETLTPLDLEQRYGLTGGHVFQGEHALDQLLFMRPDPSCSRYATPVPGLFLGGSGSHPGGGVTCGPGLLGARATLAATR